MDQWVSLTEERNAVLVPAAGSSIPGAPADWDPPTGMEAHVPVLFLDLNGEKIKIKLNKNVNSILKLYFPMNMLILQVPKCYNCFYKNEIFCECHFKVVLHHACMLPADDFSTQGYGGDSLTLAGNNAIIPKENCNKFFQLPFVKCYEKDVCAVASWDSSIHDNMYLNRLTPSMCQE